MAKDEAESPSAIMLARNIFSARGLFSLLMKVMGMKEKTRSVVTWIALVATILPVMAS